MSGFTPGPWVPRRAVKPDNTGGYDWAIIAPDKAILAECFEVVDWAENGVDFDTRPVEANARLIASAPDLLEAVIQYRDDLKRPPTGDSIERRLAMVNAAIAKATGAAS